MSKAFTALSILKLRDEGRLALDSPAEAYVPEMRNWRYPTSDSPRITVRNLLTHSAGFVEDNPWGDRQQMMPEAEFTALLAGGVPFARAPGLAMEYSNFGYATLGRIVSNVSGTRYEDYIRRELMMPLGMASSGYDVLASPPERRAIGYRWQDDGWVREPDMRDGAFGAMGGVETSANDYAKWVAFLLSAWPARDGPDAGPVRRSTVREIVTGANFVSGSMRNPAAGGSPCRDAIAYGMAWRVVDDCDLGRIVDAHRRLSRLRFGGAAAPRQGHRPVRLQQQDLRRRFAADTSRSACAGKGWLPHRPGGSAQRRACQRLCGGAGGMGKR